jgi:aspartate/methionine/tyrosine aminotransferase
VTRRSRWDQVQVSIFSKMTELAQRYHAVNLAQGFPNFDGPSAIKEAAITAIMTGKNQYAPSRGPQRLRELLSERMERLTSASYDPQHEVAVFSGATEALFTAFLAHLEPGDEVISFAPHYDSYPAAAMAAYATFVPVNLHSGDWSIDPVSLRRAVTRKTKMIILNTPHNPTGRVATDNELQVIVDLACEHDLLVVTDEVYNEIYFERRHRSIAEFPGMRERTIVISSTSKTFSYTGWKVGYAFAPASLLTPMHALHQFVVFCSATPLMEGMTEGLMLPETYYQELRRDYTARRDLLLDDLRRAGFSVRVPEGAYFVLADYSSLSALPDTEFCEILVREAKVAAIPLSVFYRDTRPDSLRFVRFAFAKDLATLKEAGERLLSWSKICQS